MITSLNFWRLFSLLRVGVIFAVMMAVPAQADDAPDSGFFSYLPSVPDIKLPKLQNLVPFWTDDLKRAKKAYSKGDYGRAHDLFQKSSEDGNIVADWFLGHMYRLGRGVAVDPATAYSYYSRAAENFDPDEPDQTKLRIAADSRLRMADYQRTGIPAAGLAANPQGAARTYLQFATNYSHPRALYALGVMSMEGEGMRKNPQQGLKWLNAGARKGSPEAAAYIGELYASGTVVPKDESRALSWYIIAANFAQQDENPLIFARLAQLRFSAPEEMRLEAEARARVWIEQNPQPVSE